MIFYFSSLSLTTRFSFSSSFFLCASRYAHLTFDLRGVGCRPPLLLRNPSHACWQPGSKGCRTLVASYHVVGGDVRPPRRHASTAGRRTKQTLQLHFIIYVQNENNFFYLSGDENIINNFWVRSHWSLLLKGHFQ